jgi:hypothetical protein
MSEHQRRPPLGSNADPMAPPLTEPTPAPEIFFEGVDSAELQNGVAKLTCFTVVNTGSRKERRIVARLTVPIGTMIGLHQVTSGFIDFLQRQQEAANEAPAKPEAA